MEKQPPNPLALIVADSIHVDPGSQKKTILGTFSNIFSQSFPVAHPLIAVYAVATDGYGPTEFMIRIVDVDDTNELASVTIHVDFEDPRAVVEMPAFFTNVT